MKCEKCGGVGVYRESPKQLTSEEANSIPNTLPDIRTNSIFLCNECKGTGESVVKKLVGKE